MNWILGQNVPKVSCAMSCEIKKPSGAPARDNAINKRKKQHVMRHLRTPKGEKKMFPWGRTGVQSHKGASVFTALRGINRGSVAQSVLFVSVYDIG